MLPFAVDKSSELPLYHQIKDHLIRQIEIGLLMPGARLPATRDLADQLGVARISVVAAYEDLKAQGYITTHVGRGSYVTQNPLEAGAPELGRAAIPGRSHQKHTALYSLMKTANRPGVINFGRGAPPETFLPVERLRIAIDSVLTQDGTAAIAYEMPEGYLPLRQQIAKKVLSQGITTDPGNILVTGGCQQALDLAVQALLNPGDVLLVGSPTYSGILNIAEIRRIEVIGVPVDEEGIQVELVESLIGQHLPRLIYVAPTYHNPTGTVMPIHRRRRLLALAERYQIPILEDGVYEELGYSHTCPPPLKALDNNGLVLYASSFSKVLMPGMRIGYLIVDQRLYRRLASVKHAADVCTPALNQRAVTYMLERGWLDEHLDHLKEEFRVRRDVMIQVLAYAFPDAQWFTPQGGIYVWIKLPEDGPSATDLYIHAVQMGVAFAPGLIFFPDGQGERCLRLNMVAYPPEVIEEGVRRLAGAWADLVSRYSELADQPTPLPL